MQEYTEAEKQENAKKTVFVGMSGGVDSSVFGPSSQKCWLQCSWGLYEKLVAQPSRHEMSVGGGFS